MHHKYCDWWLDQYDFECTCGATARRAPWFDRYVAGCDAVMQAAIEEARSEAMTRREIEEAEAVRERNDR